MSTKRILVLGRRDHGEAMRVAAGLTIVGHGVRLVLMTKPVPETRENEAHAELLELSDIVPVTTVSDQGLEVLDPTALAAAVAEADAVVNL